MREEVTPGAGVAAPTSGGDSGAVAPARRRRPERRHLLLAGLLIVLASLPMVLYPLLTTYSYWMQMLTILFMWVAMASSWNILGGYGGYISLGHNVFYAVGAYTAAALLVYGGISPFITAPLAGLVCVALGVGIGVITLRTRGPAFIISTIALMLIARLLLDRWGWLGGSNGISLPMLDFGSSSLIKVPFYYAMLLCAVLVVVASYRLKHSKFGLGLRAIAEDEVKAEVAGINTRRYKVAAFALSGFFIGVVGAIWGYSLFYLRPEAFLTLAVAADMVLMAIIGGRGTVAGPVIGAVLIVSFNEFAVAQLGSSEANIAVTGALLIVVLMAFPLGIVGTLRDKGRLPRFLDWD